MLQIDEHVQREIMNHRSLKHPNIVRFKEVCILLCKYTFNIVLGEILCGPCCSLFD